jgi:predicted SprT family Zn-dependent metalloprotease
MMIDLREDKRVYTARKVQYLKECHPEFDIDFRKGDEFTVSIHGDKIHIVHEAEPELTFKIGYKDKRYRELLKASESLSFDFVPDPVNPVYPYLGQELTLKEVRKLYDFFNEKYFNGECPDKVKIVRGTQDYVFGMAELNFRKGTEIKLHVNLTEIGRDPYMFVDVVLHEMIHLLMYQKYLNTKNTKYAKAAHGPLFIAEMQRLNASGFNIAPVLKFEDEAKFTSPYWYILDVECREGHNKYHRLGRTDKNLSEINIDKLVAGLGNALVNAVAVRIYRTRSEMGRQIPRLGVNNKFRKADIDKKSPGVVDVIKDAELIKGKEVPPVISLLADPEVTSLLSLPFDDFAAEVSRKINDQSKLRIVWLSATDKQIKEGVSTSLDRFIRAVRRGMAKHEVEALAKTVYMCAYDRMPESKYRTIMESLVKTKKAQPFVQGYEHLLHI